MAKQGAKTAVPRLRFPEFQGASGWNPTPLGKLGAFIRGLTYGAGDVQDEGLLVIRSANIQGGALVFDKNLVFVGKRCAPDQALQPGDIAICMSNGSKALVGKSAEYSGDYPGSLTVGAFCSIFRPSIAFAKFAFESDSYADFVALAIGGGNINNLKNSDLESFEFPIPVSPSEQQKIADCLVSLDEVIAAQGRKVEALKAHKRGLMQQLFPREGETRPRLRFPEFRNAPEWKKHRLGDIASISKGKGISKADIAVDGRTPCIRYGELYTVYGEVIDQPLSRTNIPTADLVLSQAGDVIVPASGETKEDIATSSVVLCAGIALGGDLNIIRLNVDGRFFSYYLNGAKRRALAKVAQGDTVVHLYPRQLEQLDIAIPVDYEEQQRIADCLSSLDTQITAETARLAALKTHKQGLMQQLFPAPESV